MGIYIKGMEMPNSCVECPLYKESACDAFETLAPYTFKDNERASFCPLTEVEEPKTGEWTNAGVLTVHCSNCKSEFHELEAMNFCPNCGADMRGGDTE